MITSDSSGAPTYVRINTGDVESLARTEWLLTNGLGGFAMGSVLGAMSRRYHGLLVASLRPPVQRMMMLTSLAESLLIDPGTPAEQRFDLACFRFRPGELHPRGDAHLERFEKDVTCRWYYKVGTIGIVKELVLVHGQNTAMVRYTITPGSRLVKAVRLVVRPLVAMRDFHALTLRDTSHSRLGVEHGQRTIVVHSPEASLHMAADGGGVEGGEQWWYNFQYELERERGYDFLEDLYNPGAFVADFPHGQSAEGAPARLTISAGVRPVDPREFDAAVARNRERLGSVISRAREVTAPDPATKPDPAEPAVPGTVLASLVAAADDFVVRRQGLVPASGGDGKNDDAVSIIAGYPWFADWGRDATISLPGLLLTTGRYAEARRLLLTFAAARGPEGGHGAGLVPNLFDDYTGQPHYNTVDASLWFIHACCEYVRCTRDTSTFASELLPACLDVVGAFRRGTSFGIGTDPEDGLVFAGDESTQLTWMDAKRDGVVFTPRHGKAVEINALWCHALASLAEAAGPQRMGIRNEMTALAARAAGSFARVFWNPEKRCLLDTVSRDHSGGWRPNDQIRPNQIFAVSLRHSPLSGEQKIAVVNMVRSRLLTPHGVRTLDPADPGYKGRYEGRMFDRDAAYHNGTAWPWLLGPLAEAVLRAGGFSNTARQEAREILRPLIESLDADCVGQLSEVCDGDHMPRQPQRSAGCPAQAWSVAETLRLSVLIARGEG